jgi:hypothetical protein
MKRVCQKKEECRCRGGLYPCSRRAATCKDRGARRRERRPARRRLQGEGTEAEGEGVEAEGEGVEAEGEGVEAEGEGVEATCKEKASPSVEQPVIRSTCPHGAPRRLFALIGSFAHHAATRRGAARTR